MNADFLKLINTTWKANLFLLKKLPSAYFSGVRILEATPEKCVTKVPFKWFSQNPFKSTYFASLAMAAELSTGVLALGNIWKRKPSISMLVVDMKGNFLKKAVDVSTFICNDGNKVISAIEKAIAEGTSQSVTLKSVGKNKANEVVAEFEFTWSFKAKA